MKKSTVISCLALVVSGGFVMSANAQTPTCADVEWGADILERNPGIANHCREVVERNGAWYAKVHAKIVRQGATSTVVRYQDPDGTWSESERTYPPRGFTASIGGEDVQIAQLRPGQEVNVYIIDEENFSIPMLTAAASTTSSMVEEVEEEVVYEDTYEEPAPAMLPKTATQTYWLALMGGLLLLVGGGLRAARLRL